MGVLSKLRLELRFPSGLQLLLLAGHLALCIKPPACRRFLQFFTCLVPWELPTAFTLTAFCLPPLPPSWLAGCG